MRLPFGLAPTLLEFAGLDRTAPGSRFPDLHGHSLAPAHRDLVARYGARLEDLITAEVGADTRAWVTERPRLLGRPTWHGDTDRPVPAGAAARG